MSFSIQGANDYIINSTWNIQENGYMNIYIKLMCPLEIQMSHSQIRSAKQISTLVSHLAGLEKIIVK